MRGMCPPTLPSESGSPEDLGTLSPSTETSAGTEVSLPSSELRRHRYLRWKRQRT